MEKLCPKSVLITGANRGIGLTFVSQFCRLPNPPAHIFATYRKIEDSQELLEIAKLNPVVRMVQFDVRDYEKLPSLVQTVTEFVGVDGLNLLINNAGIVCRDKLESINHEDMIRNFEVNAVGPVMITKAFLPLLKTAVGLSPAPKFSCSHAAIINITSKVGSIADNKSGYRYSYRMSKAALNMASASMSVDLKDTGILVGLLHPGYVETRMTGPEAYINTEESVCGMMQVMAGLNEDKHGAWFDYKGNSIPW